MNEKTVDIVGLYDQLDIARSKGSVDDISRLEREINLYRYRNKNVEKKLPSRAVKLVRWALLASLFSLVGYYTYSIRTCEDCTEIAYRNITIPSVTKEKSAEFHLQFMREVNSEEVNRKFPSLRGKANSIIVLRTKHHTDATTGHTYVEIDVGYKYAPKEIKNPKQKEILDFYTSLVLEYFSGEINDQL